MTDFPTTAMVLAAGLGKRMRPLTALRPKPLVEVGGRTMLDRTLDHLRAAGVQKAVVNVHYLADQVEAHLAGRDQGLEIAISDERAELLETGGGVTKALPLIDGAHFFVVNSDNLWVDGVVPSLQLLAQHWNPDAMDALLLLVRGNQLTQAIQYVRKHLVPFMDTQAADIQRVCRTPPTAAARA